MSDGVKGSYFGHNKIFLILYSVYDLKKDCIIRWFGKNYESDIQQEEISLIFTFGYKVRNVSRFFSVKGITQEFV